MKISDIRYTRVRIPLRSPFEWAQQRTRTTVHYLIEVETDDGIVGLGDCYGYYPQMGSFIDCHKASLIGADPFQPDRVGRTMTSLGASNTIVGAVDTALWDIKGKALGRPLCEIMGGAWRDRIPVAPMLGINPPDHCGQEAVRYVRDLGVRTIKLKLGKEAGLDLDIVREVRRAIGPDVALRPDPNHAWTYATAKRLIRLIGEFDPEFVEQPIPGYRQMALLKKEVGPVALACCESITSIFDLMDAIKIDAADVYNIDVFRTGGVLNWIRAAGMIEAAGFRIGMHTHPHTGIWMALQLHMAAATRRFVDAMDIVAPEEDIADDIVKEDVFKVSDGYIQMPTGPGLGVTLDADKVQKYQVADQRATLEYADSQDRIFEFPEGYY